MDSTTLEEPLENTSTLIKGRVAEEITKLKQQPGKDSGKRLFEGESAQKALSLVDSRTFGTGVLYLTHQPARSWRS